MFLNLNFKNGWIYSEEMNYSVIFYIHLQFKTCIRYDMYCICDKFTRRSIRMLLLSNTRVVGSVNHLTVATVIV